MAKRRNRSQRNVARTNGSLGGNKNCGVEGPTDDAAVEALRSRRIKNFQTVTVISIGVPMWIDTSRPTPEDMYPGTAPSLSFKQYRVEPVRLYYCSRKSGHKKISTGGLELKCQRFQLVTSLGVVGSDRLAANRAGDGTTCSIT